jgi:hypothetical protein
MDAGVMKRLATTPVCKLTEKDSWLQTIICFVTLGVVSFFKYCLFFAALCHHESKCKEIAQSEDLLAAIFDVPWLQSVSCDTLNLATTATTT